MVCLLIDDWLYMDMEGKVGVYGLQELDRNLKSRLKELNVAFLDYQTKHISFIDQRSAYQDVLINSSFDESYLITQERLSTHLIQVIGAKKDRIEEIYQNLKGSHVDVCVPYGIAIRAFLRSKDLLNVSQCTIFLDDLRNQAVLTIFEGSAFSSPRKIRMRDAEYLLTEIKRSWQNFNLERSMEGKIDNTSFTLISNNQEWLRLFVEQGYVLKENIVHINQDFAVLDGLKNAKFSTHFAPAKEILKQKKSQLWKQRTKLIVVSLLLVTLGIGSYILATMMEKKEQEMCNNLQRKEIALEAQLRNSYQGKFLSLLSMRPLIDYTKIYYDFIRSLPRGYVVDNFFFEKKGDCAWFFQGEIYPEDEYVIQDNFRGKNSFLSGEVSPAIIKKSLGQRIFLKINRKEDV